MILQLRVEELLAGEPEINQVHMMVGNYAVIERDGKPLRLMMEDGQIRDLTGRENGEWLWRREISMPQRSSAAA